MALLSGGSATRRQDRPALWHEAPWGGGGYLLSHKILHKGSGLGPYRVLGIRLRFDVCFGLHMALVRLRTLVRFGVSISTSG